MRNLLLVVATFIVACAIPPRSAVPSESANLLEGMRELYWYTESAEARVLYLAKFQDALEHLRRASSGRPRDSWAVIADADETLIDNRDYRLLRARQGLRFTAESWEAWISGHLAIPTPGALEFARTVKSLGGRLYVVTNRSEVSCGDTIANLTKLEISAVSVLCKPVEAEAIELGEVSKQRRFDAVAASVGGRQNILAYLGDNIEDFPAMSQKRGLSMKSLNDLDEFSEGYFLFPNPMYGSWEH